MSSFLLSIPSYRSNILGRLTVGPAVGSIRELFSKVKAIDAKHGKFELVLCVGDFFGPESEQEDEVRALLSGEIEGICSLSLHVRLDALSSIKCSSNYLLCYARGPSYSSSRGSEICGNRRSNMPQPLPSQCVLLMRYCALTLIENPFPGKSGFLTTSHGLRIGCLGGLFDEQIYSSTETPLVRM